MIEHPWIAELVDSTDIALIARDLDGTIVLWNEAAERLYGYTPAEAVGHLIAILVPPEARDEYDQITERVARGERVNELETVRLRKDGSRVHVSLTVSPLRDSNGGVVGAGVTVRDLSDRDRRETEISKGRARLRSILDTAGDAIVSIDWRGVIQTINPATERLFGYTAAELIGQNVKMLMPAPYREEHDGYLSRYRETGEKRIIGMGREVQARRKDGTVFPIDLAVSEVEPGTLFTGIIRDLSERSILDAKLREADRMAMIGTVAAGLGHDLNNLLMVLRMNTDALSTGSLSTSGAAALQSLGHVNDYLRDLARGLKLVALDPQNKGDGTSLTTRLTDWRPATAALLKTVTRPGVAIEVKIPPGLPDVAMASHHLTQVVFNLVDNAINAIGDAPGTRHGVVWVTASPRPGGNGVRLQVADTGSGMSPEVLARAFEPLFTTRSGCGGTGLGLALVQRLVTEAGAEVSIESKLGTGTIVTVDLRAAPPVEAVSDDTAGAPGAVVLLADADAAALVRSVLVSLGTAVGGESDFEEARLCVVDPAAADVKTAEQWLAARPHDRRLVLFGKPPTDCAPAWESLQPLTIEDPDDFECLRMRIAQAVTAG